MTAAAHGGRGPAQGPRAALAWLVLFAVLWTAVETIAAPLLSRMSPYQVVWMRYAIHLVVVFAIWGRRGPRSLARTRRLPLQLGRSALMIAMPASWATAVAIGIEAHDVMAVFWVAPMMIVAFAFALGQERFHPGRWLAAGAAVIGAWLATTAFRLPGASEWPLPLAMAASFALYVVLTRSLRDEPIAVNLFWTGAGVFLPMTAVMPFVWVDPHPADLARMAVVGGLGVVGLYALDRLAAAAPVGLTAPAHAIQPAAFVAISVAASGSPGRAALAGALAIAALVVGIWLAASPRRVRIDAGERASAAALRRPGASE